MERLLPYSPENHGKPRVDDPRVLSGIVSGIPNLAGIVFSQKFAPSPARHRHHPKMSIRQGLNDGEIMKANTDQYSSTSDPRNATWQERKEHYATMIAAARLGDLPSAKLAYTKLIAGRNISTISSLAALGRALESGTASIVSQAARNLHQARTGQSYCNWPRAEACVVRNQHLMAA